MGTKIIKCLECGTINENKEYCSNCNAIISDAKKRALKAQQLKEAQIKEEKFKLDNPSLTTRLKTHPNIFLKSIGWVLYSVITIVSIIGAGLAWFIAMVAAG